MLQCLSHAAPAPSQPQGPHVALIRISALSCSVYLMELMLAGLLHKVGNPRSPFCGQQKLTTSQPHVLFPLFDHAAIGRKRSAAVRKLVSMNEMHSTFINICLKRNCGLYYEYPWFMILRMFKAPIHFSVSCDYNFVVLWRLRGSWSYNYERTGYIEEIWRKWPQVMLGEVEIGNWEFFHWLML